MKKTALIMAGGKGERFWPKSRTSLPKQFLSLTNDGKTMIQLTVERIKPLINLSDIYIATNEQYKSLVLEQLPGIPEENILCEPVGRNTAPCIGLGAVHISKKYEDALMIVLPSDHLVKDNTKFIEIVGQSFDLATDQDNLVTIGIKPNYPETGYGYINFNMDHQIGNAYEVNKFVEKPELELAVKYIEAGNYLWNSGMFIWKVSTIINCFNLYMNDIYSSLLKIKDSVGTKQYEAVLRKEFTDMRSESIDYGVMEHAHNIYSFIGNFGWDDVGSWLAVERIKDVNEDGNTVGNSNVVTINTQNCIIEGADRLIATVGIKDIVIVDTKDALLVCNKSNTGDIKKVLEQIRNLNKNSYL